VKLMRRLRETGSVTPDRIGGHRRPLLEPHQDLLQLLVEAKSSITLAEIQSELRIRGVEVQALSTIHLMLRRMGLTRKTYGPPRLQEGSDEVLRGLRKRIRSREPRPAAKMEIRSPWSS
jgi:putative transposase